MNKILSPSWWMSMLVSTFMTMLFIYIIKTITAKINIPVISAVAQAT